MSMGFFPFSFSTQPKSVSPVEATEDPTSAHSSAASSPASSTLSTPRSSPLHSPELPHCASTFEPPSLPMQKAASEPAVHVKQRKNSTGEYYTRDCPGDENGINATAYCIPNGPLGGEHTKCWYCCDGW